jgi:hypothetical protein
LASGRGKRRSPMQEPGKNKDTLQPFVASEAANSEPMKPPPMTANSAPRLAKSRTFRKSVRRRKYMTEGSLPFNLRGDPPVASRSL